MAETNPQQEKTFYSPDELEEFKTIILEKMDEAKKNLDMLKEIMSESERSADDTAPVFKTMEEGSTTLSKEENAKLAARQQKYIRDLEAALVRIANGTYGICKVTGKLIPKERLRVVPHTTMTIEAKNSR